MKPKIYLAGPISGCSYSEATTWREQVTWFLGGPFEILNPMSHKSSLAGNQAIEPNLDTDCIVNPKAIVTRDRFMVQQSDIVLFNLSYGNNPLIGTATELGWADAWQKTKIAVIDRESLYWHPFISELCYCVPTLSQAIEVLTSYSL